MSKLTRQDLKTAASTGADVKSYVKIGLSTCGIAAGAQDVFDTFLKEIKHRDIEIELKRTGCIGMCHAEPLVEVAIEGLPSVTYGGVTTDVALRIVEEHLCGKRVVNDHVYDLPVRR